jgi:hypothetical protein
MLPTFGRTFCPVRQKNSAAEEKISDFLKMQSHFDQIISKNAI